MNPFTPNFENAKVGDAVWCYYFGNAVISSTNEDYVSVKFVSCGSHMLQTQTCWIYNGCSYEYFDHTNGTVIEWDSAHPTLFNSFQQFLDYWKWEWDKRGEDA